jgi:cytoplasmic iron level regulating protein YaaA (DUF328/UPF0246 family)
VLVLVPPSEGKAAGGRGVWSEADGAFGELAPHRRSVIDALGRVGYDDPAVALKVFGARGELAERAAAAVSALRDGTAPARPAWQRFTGVVWEHLDPASLPAASRRRIVVPSALLGLCRGTDPVPDFRLKLSVSLPGVGRLDRFWRPTLTAALAGARGPIVDLLPKEHAAALDMAGFERRVVRVCFVDGGGAAVGHDAKAVKGVVARVALLEGVDALDGLAWQGWRARRAGPTVEVRRD